MAAVILAGPLLGLPAGVVPLIAVQILFVNLATDGLPAIALSVDPPDPDIMSRKPRPRKQSIFTPNVMGYLLIAGIWTAAVSLGAFLWADHRGLPASEAQSMCFVTLILVEFFNAFNCRSLDFSVFQIGLLRNKWLVVSVLGQVPLLLAIVYWAPLQRAFNTHSLNMQEWLIALGLGSSIFFAMEIFKLVKRLVVKPHERSSCD
jgi:Ca2+-transporting ATPase